MSVKMSMTSNVPLPGTITWSISPGSPPPEPGTISCYTIIEKVERPFTSFEGRPFVCPVCGGRGTISRGFYDWLAASTTDATPEMCRSCCSTGIVWR